MTELGDDFRYMKKKRQAASEERRKRAPLALDNAGIPFTSHNAGAHLIIEGPKAFIDYWPGTGKWIERGGHQGFGLRKLIKYAGGQ